MRTFLRTTTLALAGAVAVAALGPLGSAQASGCHVCVQQQSLRPGAPGAPVICLKWSSSCVASKVPVHFHGPSPVESKAPQIYRHYPSHR